MAQHQTQPTRADFRFWWAVTVRWGDMDAMGHVNNVMYFQYIESARIGFVEALGWETSIGTGPRQGPAVVSQTYNYRRQVFYPDELEVGVRCQEVRGKSFVLEFGLFRKGTEDLVGDGISVMVWLDYDAGKALPIPPGLRHALSRG